jgi:predicted nucleic acid-binding protein
MRYVLVTDWAVWWLRDRPVFVDRIWELRSEGLAISAATGAELATGVRRSSEPNKSEQVLRHVLQRVTVFPFTEFDKCYIRRREQRLPINRAL